MAPAYAAQWIMGSQVQSHLGIRDEHVANATVRHAYADGRGLRHRDISGTSVGRMEKPGFGDVNLGL